MRPSRRPVTWFVLWSLLAAPLGACELVADPGAAELLEAEQNELATQEGFEVGSKGSYADADVTLGSGTWSFDEALIGALAGDVKNGAKAARVRASGRITMRFDRNGAGTLTIKHATYGSDASGAFAVYYSLNGGSSWTPAGASVTTGGSLASASFTINKSGAIRFQLRKTDGGSGRINLDDLVITDFGGTPSLDAGVPPTDPPPSTPGRDISKHTTLGLPSPSSASNWNSYLSVKSQYVLSYNSARKVPNWVSWELNSAYLGSAPRQDDYRTDNTLPAGMPQATLGDYSGSGWDRGHMCPSAERTATVSANSQTFVLSNMVPQANENNGGPWAGLETYERSLASNGKELFVIAGGVYSASSDTIGANVSVPDWTWKVVVVLDKVGDGPAQVSAQTRVIGVLMPNDNGDLSPGDDWRSFRVSVRSIEALTKFNFLSDVPKSVQDVVETQVDNL